MARHSGNTTDKDTRTEDTETTETGGPLDMTGFWRGGASPLPPHDPALEEPSLYEQVLPYLDDEQRDYLATLTPFARELQLWLWNRPGPKWSHAQLAKALGISPNTVNAWFSRGTRPEGNSYHKLKELTGWQPQHLMALTGYVQEPPYEPDVWQFLLDDLRRQRQFVDDQERIGGWLRDAQARYNARPKRPTRAQRPGTARGGRKTKTPASDS